MANRSRDVLSDDFDSLATGQGTSGDVVSGTVSSVASTLDELTRQASRLMAGTDESGSINTRQPGGGGPLNSSASELDSVDVSAQSGSRLNTSPTTETVGQAPAAASSGSSALSIASSIFESGLGIVPLVSGLLGLFGGGSPIPPPLERYVMPDQLYLTGADTPNGIGNSDYDQFGMPRLYGQLSSSMTTQTGSNGLAGATGGTSAGASPQVNVTVQAMDSQSFLDHSSEIAQAVRQAMLNLSFINDVVNQL
jgi:hypothetical protein